MKLRGKRQAYKRSNSFIAKLENYHDFDDYEGKGAAEYRMKRSFQFGREELNRHIADATGDRQPKELGEEE